MNCSSAKNVYLSQVFFSLIFFILILLFSNTLKSQTLDFPYFESLPSENGWTYFSNTSDTIFTIVNSMLVQNSFGLGSVHGFYLLDIGSVIIPTATWSLKVRARVTEVGGGNSGFFFSVTQNNFFYSVRLTTNAVYIPDEEDYHYQTIENNNTVFHDFILSGGPTEIWTLIIDDIVRAEGTPVPFYKLDFIPIYDLAFGDGTINENVNANGEWASFVFSQNCINPTIISITDVPNDQGGWVYVNWSASSLDTGMITQYGIWEENPEGELIALGNVPAIQATQYTYLAHTFCDSSMDGICWSMFKVTAHTVDPSIFYASEIDYGYSIDNIAPAVPNDLIANIALDTMIVLNWNQPVDEDFNFFRIYRSLELDFNPADTEPLSETANATYTDTETEQGITYYYKISAVDIHGNESALSEKVAVTIPQSSIAESRNLLNEFSLLQNYPNPFNPTTTICYSIPEKSHVTMTIYNLAGQVIEILVNQMMNPGDYSIQWDASKVQSGIYFYRINAKEFIDTKKCLIFK